MLRRNISDLKLAQDRVLRGKRLNLDEFDGWVNGTDSLSIGIDGETADRIAASATAVTDAIIDQKVIYGVTTGFGGMSNSRIDCHDSAALQANLLSFLAAGTGPEIDASHTRGAMLLRANVLLQGKSGIRLEVIERLIKFLQADAVPVVREYGSIGASGDLVPLATIARAITGNCGKVNIRLNGEIVDLKSVLGQLELDPIELRAKEGLALVNGTSFSTAIAANATTAAKRSMALSFVVQSILMRALQVDLDPFQAFVHESKPHPGQVWSADVIRDLLSDGVARPSCPSGNVQDRYSLRCFPQYAGSIVEGIARVQHVVETEMNAVSDNPLIDPETGAFYQSGNFLGQYIGIAMDDLRRFIGLLAKHLDVQIASLVAPEFNHGLSPSLRGNDERKFNMGLKGLQICGNSIMPMLTYFGNPIVEHFPTHAEQFNQNINGLSWGAANMAWKSVGMFQHYLAVASIFAIQAIDLRTKSTLGHYDGSELLGSTNRQFYSAVCEILSVETNPDRPFLFDDSDRWLEQDIERITRDIANDDRLINSVAPVIDSFDRFCNEASP
jgi:phenylalanine ammonia-lyase